MKRSTSTRKSAGPGLWCLAALLAAALLWRTPAAQAEATEEAWTATHERGLELYRQGDFEAAARAFEEARQLGAPAPNLYNLARCYQQLGRHREALETYDVYIGLPDLPEDRRDQAQQRRAESAAQLGELEVRSEPLGAEVLISTGEREDRVSTPAKLLVDPGIYQLEFRLGERAPETREVQLAAGQQALVQLVFAQAAEVEPEPPLQQAQPPEPPSPVVEARRRSWVPWLLFGSGLGLSATSGVLWGLSYSSSLRTERFTDISAFHDWQYGTYDMALAGDILVGIGAALAVAGIVWLIVDRFTRPEAGVEGSGQGSRRASLLSDLARPAAGCAPAAP